MRSLNKVERVTRDVYVTLILCSAVLVTMHYSYTLCREYWRWYCYAPSIFSYILLLTTLVLSFFMWRQNRILAVLGFMVSLLGMVVVSLPVL